MRRFSPVERLTPDHRRSSFDCGSPAQTEWFTRYAMQAEQAGTARVYVVRRLSDENVVGFFALSVGAVLPEDASARLSKGAGKYPTPVVILTRLGVDVSEGHGGLGTALLKEALSRVHEAAEIVGVRAMLIHAETDSARDWYLKRSSFEASPTDPNHLLLLMKDLRRALDL